VSLAEAAVEANALADAGSERELAELRSRWDEEVEGDARSQDFRVRAVAYRAIGQFRFRQKTELLRRGLEDASPACRGSALLSLELLSRAHPGVVNGVRPLLHELVSRDDNDAVRRLAVVALRNGSAQRDTIAILSALADDDEAGRDLRDSAGKVAQQLRRKAGPSR
jgi:HEAT repeat protein